MPAVRVHGGLIAAMAAALAAFGAIVLRAALRARRLPVVTGNEALVGRRAIAESDLSPEGVVDLDGERWRAVAHDGTVRAGEQVQIVRVEGITLHVIPQ
jgi:membrane-bound serine protease (ClpP class)